jgi:hypothetical protein
LFSVHVLIKVKGIIFTRYQLNNINNNNSLLHEKKFRSHIIDLLHNYLQTAL